MDDKGFTQVNNSYLEKLYNSQLPYETRILLFLIRKITGFHKKKDKVSYTEITNATGIDRRRVIECMKRLEDKKIVRITRKSKSINVIELVGSAEKRTKGSAENGTYLVRKSAPLKDNTKERPSADTLLEERSLKGKKSLAELEAELGDEYEL